mgnify:CR=1 FL=1
MSKELDHILEKAKSEAKRDAVREFFIKRSRFLIKIALIIIITVVSIVAIFIIKNNRQIHYSKILHQAHLAQESKDLQQEKKLLQEIINSKKAPSSILSLASFRYADLLLQDSKNKEAIDIFNKIAKCNSCEEFTQDLAKLLAIKTWILDDNLNQDKALTKKMHKFAAQAKYLKHHINEQMALYEKSLGNLQKSYEIFNKIANAQDATNSVKVRAQTHVSDLILKIDQKSDVKN